MNIVDYKKLSPEGQILADEMSRIKRIVEELRDGVEVINREDVPPAACPKCGEML